MCIKASLHIIYHYFSINKLPKIIKGHSQEFSFTEERLNGKGTSDAGGLGMQPPQLTKYIKVTFSNLLNSYDNTMAFYVRNLCTGML